MPPLYTLQLGYVRPRVRLRRGHLLAASLSLAVWLALILITWSVW